MKTKNEPKERGTAPSNKSRQTSGGGSKTGKDVQKDAETRSRGDSPSADKRSERSPKTENL
ncbi:MAG TPA: hypothetical protein VEQ65_00520 [Opitutus sp.]|nr:hypothetical protein [Opitutus sp.]